MVERGFKPVWKSSHPVDPAKVLPGILASKRDFSEHMHDVSTLLIDPAYYKAFRIGRDCNQLPAGQRPTKAACDANLKAMVQMEKNKGILGMATMQLEHR